jgi:predicted amidophosphoribosyltransferase
MNQPPVPEREKLLTTGTSMTCFCPHCHASLVQGAHVVLEVERGDQESGRLQLSPLLNVFDCSSTIELAEGVEVADLRCAGCKQTLGEAEVRCGLCHSRAARFLVEVDGEEVDFYICMRKGCHWHDVSRVARSRLILEAVGFRRPDRPAELIQSGTRLQCVCPACDHDLVDGENLIVHIRNDEGDLGVLELSPYLNDFRSASTLELAKGSIAKELLCPHCGASLRDEERRCNLCAAPSALFKVRTSGGDARIYVCMRRKCHWHHLDDEARAWTVEPD